MRRYFVLTDIDADSTVSCFTTNRNLKGMPRILRDVIGMHYSAPMDNLDIDSLIDDLGLETLEKPYAFTILIPMFGEEVAISFELSEIEKAEYDNVMGLFR